MTTPTAREILEKHYCSIFSRESILAGIEDLTPEALELFKEYGREIASIAWESGYDRAKDRFTEQLNKYSEPDKETFIKQLFEE